MKVKLDKLLRIQEVISVLFLSMIAVSLLLFEQQLEKSAVLAEKKLAQNETLRAAQNLRVKLSTELIQAVDILYGLRAFIQINPDITQQEFEGFSESLMRSNKSIRSIAAAPDLVVQYIYPLEENKAALGLDYRSAPIPQRAAAFRTMRDGRAVVAGPVKLVQGGLALIVRLPVYLTDNDGVTKNWGLIAAPIEVETFYEEVGLPDFTKDFDLALRGTDGLGSEGEVFYGREDLYSSEADSVLMRMELVNGSWVMAVRPKMGWPVTLSNSLFLRLSFFAVFIIVAASWIAGLGYFKVSVQARLRQKKALREKSEFLEIMSHEIRSPLQGVLGAQKYMLDSGIDGPMRTVVEEAHQSGQYIYSLINDYLELQRAESESLAIYLTPTDVRAIIEQSFKIASAGEKRSSLSVSFYVDENVPKSLMLDQAKIRQILVNIIGNAMKYTNRGFISIGANFLDNQESSVLVLKIEDTGIGIEKRELAHLFDRFTRTKHGEKRVGSGLGLAIAKSLIDEMKGRIEVESILGKGTVFTVTLPTNISPVQTEQTMIDEISLPGKVLHEAARRNLLADARILVADDVVVNRILIHAMLSTIVGKVSMVEDGVEALEELSKNPYDIVIMDVSMPHMNGMEATRRIRKNSKLSDLAIIGLTGDDSSKNHKMLLLAGMDEVLVKPISLEPLLQKLEATYRRSDKLSATNRR